MPVKAHHLLPVRPPGQPEPGAQRPARSQAGSATVEAVLAFPALMLAVMMIVQFVLYFHAQSVAEAAAQDAAAIARQADGTEPAAREAGNRSLDRLGPRLLTQRDVDVDRGVTSVRVTVSAHVASLVPGLDLHVKETATGPVERFVPGDPQ
jgi:Flp pilus assembly protein TadG